MLRIACALLVMATAAAGCVIPVVLEFDTCTDSSGVEHLSGDSYGVGCRACTCESGQERCGPCECVLPGGGRLAAGQISPAEDGCNSCSCEEDGTLACTNVACPVCDGEPIACPPPPPGCVNSPFCTENGWGCRRECDGCDEAAAQMFGGCPSPADGCWWSGPICENGVWTCGELVCQGCPGEPPPCGDPKTMGCMPYAWCDAAVGSWVCDEVCDSPYCPEPQEDCTDPMLPPECVSLPICTPMGWTCQKDCFNCLDPQPMCGSMDPYCVGVAFCDGTLWSCNLVCN